MYMCKCKCKCVKVYVYAHMYMFSTFHNEFMSFCHISYIYTYIYTSCIYKYILSSIVKEVTTFQMELRGHKQATTHSHEHTKNSNPSKKKFSHRQNSNSNLLINFKNPRNRSNWFRAAWYVQDLCDFRLLNQWARRILSVFCSNLDLQVPIHC